MLQGPRTLTGFLQASTGKEPSGEQSQQLPQPQPWTACLERVRALQFKRPCDAVAAGMWAFPLLFMETDHRPDVRDNRDSARRAGPVGARILS